MCTHKQNFELVIGCPLQRSKKDKGNSKLDELHSFFFFPASHGFGRGMAFWLYRRAMEYFQQKS